MFIAISDEKLKEILEQHKIWLESNKKKGSQAKFPSASLARKDFSGLDLSEADFSTSSIFGANFQNTNLKNTNFKDVKAVNADFNNSDLTGANFGLSDLTGTKFNNANLSNTKFISAYLEDTNFNNCINIETADFSNTLRDKRTLSLSEQITLAKNSLANALKNTDQQIAENKNESGNLRVIAKILFLLDILLLILIPVLIWNPLDWHFFSTIQYKFIMLSSMLGHWAILFYSLPILTIFLMATTLLRHDQKLINEIRHFSEMKHEIELFSGLLEASQHAADSFGDPVKAAKYVEDTFTLIRNKLLKVERPAELKSDDKDELDNIKTVDLLSKITDLLNKLSK